MDTLQLELSGAKLGKA